MTNVDRKIASSETMSVSFGHGSDSTNNIQSAKTTAWMYTNGIEPANEVIASAIRSWTSAARRLVWSTTTGWWSGAVGGGVGLMLHAPPPRWTSTTRPSPRRCLDANQLQPRRRWGLIRVLSARYVDEQLD